MAQHTSKKTSAEKAFDHEAVTSVETALSRPDFLLDCIEMEDPSSSNIRHRIEGFCESAGMEKSQAKVISDKAGSIHHVPFEERADVLYQAVSPLLQNAKNKQLATRYLADFVKSSKLWQENFCNPKVLKDYQKSQAISR